MASETLVGRELAGYRIESLLGRGAMGDVYCAHDPELHRRVALKVIAAELAGDVVFRERFASEIGIAASLEHPHICPVYRAGEADGELYVAMRLIDGGSLGERVADGPLRPDSAIRLLSQVASALDYAHGRLLVHRDVSARNVLCDTSDNAFLADFGLAHAAWEPEEEELLLRGTLGFLAPECCEGAPASAASDQYALGCLAYLTLTGALPFQAEHAAALLYAHLRQEPPSLSAYGLTRLDPVLAIALAKNPAARYPNCGTFADALSGAVSRPEPAEHWPHGLPRPQARLIGRERELREIDALLEDSSKRLLTLTGPGGAGKSRLALEVAARHASAYAGGVHWVSLAPLREPAHVASEIAQVLDVHEQPGSPVAATLAEALTAKRVLLCLDNCEHLLPDVVDTIALLRDLDDGPTLLCTSRARLDLQGEQLYPVGSLSEADAIELFGERARLSDPSFETDDADIEILCARLDFLPLALELAASRSDLYSPHEMLEVLTQRLDLLHGPRDADPRHATLTSTIAWSYDLLDPREQAAFRSLSVCAGGCTTEAAHVIARAGPDLLHSLRSKSLLRTRETPLGTRYWMLETVRDHAASLLAEAGEEYDARRRHLERLLGLAEEADAGLRGSQTGRWMETLEEELADIRGALAWALQNAPEDALRLSSHLWRFWSGHSHFSEGREWLGATLARGREPSVRASALNGAGNLALAQGDYPQARMLYEQSLALLREVGNDSGTAAALANLGLVAAETDELDRARACLDESLALRRALGDPWGIAMSLNNLGLVDLYAERFEQAAELYDESLALSRDLGDELGIADSLICKARAISRSGDWQAAAGLLFEALELSSAAGDKWAVSECFEGIASCAAAASDYESAAVLLGAANALRDEIGAPPSSSEGAHNAELQKVARRELGDDAVSLACSHGRELALDAAIERARRACVALMESR